MKLLIIALCFIASFQKSLSQDNIYIMEDLRSLSSSKSHRELLEHALDILPKNRKKEWKTLVENSALAFLDEVLKESKIDSADLKLINRINKWPILKNNEFFINKRDFLYVEELKNCYKYKNNNCEQLNGVDILSTKHDIEFYYKIINILYRYAPLSKKINQYLIKITNSPLSEFYCKKRPITELSLNMVYADTKIIKKFNNSCIKILLPEIRKQIYSKKNRTRLKSLDILKTINQLNDDDLNTFQLLEYLSSSKNNSSFINKVLKSLTRFSNSYEKRQIFLHKLILMDPIPDIRFGIKTNKQILAQYRIINRNFPELLDEYFKKCLEYLEGKTKFKNGNPTPNCHKFYNQIKDQKILTESFAQRYEKATYFIK